jgi:hypothetical protein
MPDYNELLTNDTLDTGRAKIRNSINEIAAELNSALVAEGLAYPVYICVPSSGNALATLACPLDPDDQEWDRITTIVREIVGKRIGATGLTTRRLACAMAGTTMASADVTAG